jgi:hypothetical protein
MSKTEKGAGPEQPLDLTRDHVVEPLKCAISLANRELEHLRVEEESFKRFGQRVVEIEPLPLNNGTPSIAFRPQHEEALKQVQVAYRETVMAVEHYEKEYGESYTENIQGEFGNEVAELMEPNSQAGFTPVVKKAILQQASRCVRSRQQFAETVNREKDTLQYARAELNEILNVLDSVDVSGEAPRCLQRRLRELNEKRQQMIQSPMMDGHDLDGHDLRGYLYADAEWTYPILLSISRLYTSRSVA